MLYFWNLSRVVCEAGIFCFWVHVVSWIHCFLVKIRGAIKLGLRCPQNVNGIAADPQPDWSFDKLLTELNSIDKDRNLTLDFPSPFTKTEPRFVFTFTVSFFIFFFFFCAMFYDIYKSYRNLTSSKDKRCFVMHVSDDETNYADSDSDSDVEVGNSLVSGSGRRFVCDELYMRFVLLAFTI